MIETGSRITNRNLTLQIVFPQRLLDSCEDSRILLHQLLRLETTILLHFRTQPLLLAIVVADEYVRPHGLRQTVIR